MNTILDRKIAEFDQKLSAKYLNDPSPIPESDLPLALLWLEADLEGILANSKTYKITLAEIEELFNENPEVQEKVNLKRVKKAASIKRNFDKALEENESSTIASILGYAFTQDDVSKLAKLHKAKKHRKKIEELLNTCNYHAECGDFRTGNYEKYI